MTSVGHDNSLKGDNLDDERLEDEDLERVGDYLGDDQDDDRSK